MNNKIQNSKKFRIPNRNSIGNVPSLRYQFSIVNRQAIIDRRGCVWCIDQLSLDAIMFLIES